MRIRSALVLLGGLAVGGVMMPAALAAGDKAPSASSGSSKDGGKGDKHDPQNRTHISQYMETLASGNAKFSARDFPGAIAVYRNAIQLAPNDPLGHYLLGEAQSAAGNLAEAEASWTQADNFADKDPEVKIKVLFCLADLRERQKKWEDAKAAWDKYKQYVTAHADAGGAPQSADARITAIDAAIKQDKASEVVRQRIAAEKDGGT